jgi:hypothetical protein
MAKPSYRGVFKDVNKTVEKGFNDRRSDSQEKRMPIGNNAAAHDRHQLINKGNHRWKLAGLELLHKIHHMH